jgi:hypothetical protein
MHESVAFWLTVVGTVVAIASLVGSLVAMMCASAVSFGLGRIESDGFWAMRRGRVLRSVRNSYCLENSNDASSKQREAAKVQRG